MEASDHNPVTQKNKENDISLKDLIFKIKQYWKFLKSKWIVILSACLLGSTLGVIYSVFTKPIYKAELSFALEDDKMGGFGGGAALASQFGFDMGGGGGSAFSGDNLLELMKSRSMVQKTLLTPVNINGKTQTLAELYISFNNYRDIWKKDAQLKDVKFLPGADPASFSLKQDSVLRVFYNAITLNNLSVNKIDKKLSIIDIIVNSENEQFSKWFTEILAKTVSDFYVETKTKKSVQNVSILQHQADSVRRALNSALTGVATSVDATPNANPSRQILHVPYQSKQVDVQANTVILSELVKNLEISKVTLRKETPLIQIIDRPILPLEKARYSKTKGIFVGAFLAGFLIICYLIIGKFLKEL